jgi:hypothetical protein
MNRMNRVQIASQILDWLETQKLDCLYKGIHFDCAVALRVAPNNRAYVAAWNSIRFCLDGNNRPVAYLPD